MAYRPRVPSAEKVTWLLQHRSLWEGLPTSFTSRTPQGVDEASRRRLVALRQAMVREGLYSPRSYRVDIERSIHRHLAFARQRVDR